ncbi:MAG: hypothetical protein HZC17_00095 [Candidatus Omnitrophica bacterium]|nr:hypothetical protein [Candidatus Omnitrophota bacterium]
MKTNKIQAAQAEEKFINKVIEEIPLREGEKLVISIGKGKEEKLFLNQRVFFKHKESGEYYPAEKRGYAIDCGYIRSLITALLAVESEIAVTKK